MKIFRFLVIIFFVASNLILFAENSRYQFISPKPASIMVSNETNLILKLSDVIDPSTLSSELIIVKGSKSGVHTGEMVLSDDEKTIIFNPHKPFMGDEKVYVEILDGIKTEIGEEISKYSYNFKTAPVDVPQLYRKGLDDDELISADQFPALSKVNNITAALPAPPITIDTLDNPADGHIFMATWDRNVPKKYGNFIFILNKNGEIVDSVRVDGAPFDFQVQQNGLLTYALGDFSINVPLPGEDLRHVVLDSNLNFVDEYRMKNGYTTDFHEFKMLPSGNVIMMSYHTIIYDMSKIVEGGKTDAQLVINIIQEQDREKNVVFEWRNIDYIPITDSDLDLTANRINYGTINAFDVDYDDNLLLSFRNHSEIMKINRGTGEVMWRMGGPRGEFTFVGEHEENAPYYHSRQHNIRRRPNGNITMFDNGQFHQPPYSRAVEYSIDEDTKVATMVSDWRYPNGNIFCVTAGNAETLYNGGWFIGFGVPNPQFVKRNAVEVHTDGSIALELSLPNGILAYRAYKLPWKGSVDKPTFTNFEVKEGNTYSFNNESINTGIEINYISLNAADYNESKITRLPYGPVNPEFIDDIINVYPVSIIYEGFAINTQTAEFHIDLEQYPEIKKPESTVIYYREFPNQGLFVPKNTSYNVTENELIVSVNTFGELVFGVTENSYTTNTPIPYEPMNNKKLILQDSLTVKWSGKGIYNSFNVQISADSSFTTILHETNSNLSDFTFSGLTNNTKYFWRVNSVLNSEISDWSEVWNFIITDPFIESVTPSGGETWALGNSEVIRWETNLIENVFINLYQDENQILSIDTIPAIRLAYQWDLPTDLAAGENYKIQIMSESNSELLSISENAFTIIDTITSISQFTDVVPDDYSLYQNYPNPFNPTTNIEFALPIATNVKLVVYDLLGNEVVNLIEENKAAGKYSVTLNASNFASGIYIYKLVTDNFVAAKKMILLK